MISDIISIIYCVVTNSFKYCVSYLRYLIVIKNNTSYLIDQLIDYDIFILIFFELLISNATELIATFYDIYNSADS